MPQIDRHHERSPNRSSIKAATMAGTPVSISRPRSYYQPAEPGADAAGRRIVGRPPEGAAADVSPDRLLQSPATHLTLAGRTPDEEHGAREIERLAA